MCGGGEACLYACLCTAHRLRLFAVRAWRREGITAHRVRLFAVGVVLGKGEREGVGGRGDCSQGEVVEADQRVSEGARQQPDVREFHSDGGLTLHEVLEQIERIQRMAPGSETN